MAYDLKPFVINLNDLSYLLAQINFVPLFDGPLNSNGIVGFDPATMDAWDAKGNKVWDHLTHTGSYKDTALTDANVDLLGSGFPQVSSSIGIRDVTGLHNNLFGTQADWGTVDVPFRRDVGADYYNYVTSPGANYDPSASSPDVTDFMPRIISRTITTGGINLLQDGEGHFVAWDHVLYESGTTEGLAYKTLINGANVDTSQDVDGNYLTLVDGAKIVAPMGMSLAWDPVIDNASMQYTTLLAFVAALGTGDTLYGPAGSPLEDGMAIHYRIGSTYVPVGIEFNATLAIYHGLVVESGISTAGLSVGDPIQVSSNDIADAISAIDTAFGGTVGQATANAIISENSGYGLLETLGHIDFQNPGIW